jgi:hypothetical protein
MKSDAELMWLAREDATAFGHVYERYSARGFYFYRRRCRDEHAGPRSDGGDLREGVAVPASVPVSNAQAGRHF